MGAQVTGQGEQCLPPLAVTGGPLSGIDYTPPVASAQVKSAILLAGLAADGETVVREPVATRAHTEEMLAAAGADITIEPEGAGQVVRVRRSQLQMRGLHRARRPLPGRVLGGGERDQPRQPGHGDRPLPGCRSTRLRRRAPADGGHHRGRARPGNGIGSLTAYTCLLHGTVVEAAEIPSLDEVPILAVAAAAALGTDPVPRRRRAAGQGVRPTGRDRRAGAGLRGGGRGRRGRSGGRGARRPTAARDLRRPAATTAWPWPRPSPPPPAPGRAMSPPSPGGSRWPPATRVRRRSGPAPVVDRRGGR